MAGDRLLPFFFSLMVLLALSIGCDDDTSAEQDALDSQDLDTAEDVSPDLNEPDLADLEASDLLDTLETEEDLQDQPLDIAPDEMDLEPDLVEDLTEDEVSEPEVDRCGVPLPPEDYVRKVVVAHPYGEGGVQTNRYVVYDLDISGALVPAELEFEMGRAPWGEIEFTRSGRIGLSIQTDGSIGVFRIEEDGSVSVVHEAYADGFYAGALAVDEEEGRILVLDTNWVENGGGIYSVDFACDGTLSNPTLLVPTKLARAIERGPLPDSWVIAAAEVPDLANPGDDTHLFQFQDGALTYLSGTSAFGDLEYSISSSALSPNGMHLLLAENSFFGEVHRVAVVSLDEEILSATQLLEPFTDPAAIAFSPWNNAAIVAGTEADTLYQLSYSPSESEPFAVQGALPITEGRSLLPGGTVVISRGTLRGRVLVSENISIRQIDFQSNGPILDQGTTAFGEGLTEIMGAIGVQP